jgi:uncharacterized GH25 family protein
VQKRTLLGAAVIAVILAAGIWLFVGKRGGGDEAGSTAPAAARTAPSTAAERPVAGPERGGPPGGGVVLVDDDPRGELRLEGQVIDALGDPVGGATVILASNPSRTTVTETDGSFGFDGLVGRPYQIAARGPGGVAGPVTARLTASSPPVILQLRAASAVTVEVVDDAGAPVDGATVELRGLDHQTATTAGGKATLAPVIPGGYQVAAWAPGFARAFQWLRVAGEQVTARVALRRGAALAGRVIDDRGQPVAGARVVYHGASDWSVQADERLDGAVTGDDGRFRFDAVAAGSVRVDARHPEHAPGSSRIVTLDGVTAVDGVEVVLIAGAAVTGVVVDVDGRAVASARVRIGVHGAGFASAPPRQVFSDADGRFAVRGLPRRILEAVAMADAGASATTPIDTTGGDVAGIELVVDVTGTIAGVVVDPAGEPIDGVQVSALPDFRSGGGGDPSQWRLRGFPEDLTAPDGRFTLTGLAPGDYRLRASRHPRRGGRGMFGDTVTAKTGDTTVEIVLPADGGVTGKVAFDDGTAPAAFTVSVGFAAEPFATADGAFSLADLPPGDHDLQLRGAGFEPRSVQATVEPGKVADVGTVVVRKGRTIRGVVVAGGAPVPGATVYAGAQIFGTGSSNKADFGGPPGGRDVKDVVTDDAGRFSIAGFGRRDVTVVAEHDLHGRSKAIRLQAGNPAEQELTIQLEPFGSVAGIVRDGGQLAEGVAVSVQSTTAPGAVYGVASGADGAFRLDRLAPDQYKVSAMSGMNPMRGMGFFSKTVAVVSGQETAVDVAIQRGTITLAATPKPPGDAEVSGMGWIASGSVTARDGRDLQLKLAAQGEGMSSLAIIMPGQPARFRELVAGRFTVCLLPLPAGLQRQQAMQYAMEHGDDLPAFCKEVVVGAAPDEQAMTIDVEIPPLIADD